MDILSCIFILDKIFFFLNFGVVVVKFVLCFNVLIDDFIGYFYFFE